MIGFLQGIVHDLDTKKIICLTDGGVGYEIFASLNLLGKASAGQKIDAYIHTIVREQEITLYGFASKEEKNVFEKLIGISGIGPKIGLQIVSGPIEPFFNAIREGDITAITQTPGIGKKMAQKIVLELQGKLDLSADASAEPTSLPKSEAIDALVNLGYDRNTVSKVLSAAPPSANTETLVKYFLSANG